MRQIYFQGARPPPARALPLKKWDFGTSRLAALFKCAYQHTRPQTLSEGQHIHQYAALVARSCVEHHPSATCMTKRPPLRGPAPTTSAPAWEKQIGNLEYPSVGQVTDAYEANEISFRYEDKTAVGLHKSAAPPVSWLGLAGT